MAATNKDVVLVVSLVLSLVSLVLLFGVTWYFQSSLDLLQQQVEYDRELLLKLQEQVDAKVKQLELSSRNGLLVSMVWFAMCLISNIQLHREDLCV